MQSSADFYVLTLCLAKKFSAWASKKHIAFSLRMPLYSLEFIRVLRKAKSSVASLQKAPHTIKEPPPKFRLEQYRGSFLRFLQYKLKSSGPSKLNFILV